MIEVETPQEIEVVTNGVEVEARTLDVEVVDLSELDVTVAKREFVITGDDIYVPKLYDDAPQWMKDLVDIVVNNAMETGNAATLNEMASMLSQFAVSYVPLNQYTQSILDLSNEDARIHAVIETLNSNFNDGLSEANAQIINVQNTKASKDEVIAQVITTLSAQLANPTSELGATIGRIDQTTVDNQSANALSMQVLASTLEGLGEDVSGNSTALQALSTYVGVEEGVPTGTGLLADVEILQKQNDGVIETTTGTYDVIISPENPDLAQLVVTAEPYATWKATDVSGIDTRLAHIGDVYVKYADTPNGAKEYIASYKFIRTVVDSTSPYATDSDGFTWALIVDQAAQDAYELALNAYDLADGKITSYYTSTYASMLVISDGWTVEEKLRNTGDLAVVWNDSTLDNNGTWRWNGTSWVTTRDKKLVALASDVTTLNTELSNGTNTWASADSNLENSLMTEISDEGARVESKFAYGSTLVLNGTSYNSGFGIATSLTSGSGLPTGQSEFWIKADKFKLMSADGSRKSSYSPFTVDSTTGNITFNGIVSFSNISNTQGSGTNLLYNSAPKIGNETKGWSIGWSNHGMSSSLGAGFDSWRPTGGASVYVVVPGNPGIGTMFDINNSRFPVVAGARYEASAYVSSHRCNSRVTLAWFDSNGNYINEIGGSTISDAYGGPLGNWGRSTLFAIAPSNAATAQFFVRSSVTSDNPYCFVAYAYAGIASANQTVVSNWSEGSSAGVSSSDVVNDINSGQTTTIDGGKITTGSITANQINTVGLIAENINANEIVGKTITGGVINGARINGAVIKASYLDLDGDLEVLTNYIITMAMYIANPSLYTDAIYIAADNQYRIPSLSTVRESTTSADISANGSLFKSKIRSYNCANAGHNLKCVKNTSEFTVSTDTLFATITSATGYVDYSTRKSSTLTIKFAGTNIGTIHFNQYSNSGGVDNTSPGTERIDVYVNNSIAYTYSDNWTGGYLFDDPLVYPNAYIRVTISGINFRIKITQFHSISVYLENGTYSFPVSFTSTTSSLFEVSTIAYPHNETGQISSVSGYYNSSISINNMI